MRPLTEHTHKALLSVGGETILSRMIDGLIGNNVTDIVVVTGFCSDKIRQYLSREYPDLEFGYVHNEKYRKTNNIYSLALAFDSIEITCEIIVIECDLIYHREVLNQLIASQHENVALVDKFRSGMDGTVVTVENDIITSVIPPHLQGENFDFSDKYKTLNIYRFSKEFCRTSFKKLLTYYAHVIDDNCYYELILGILIYMQKDVVNAEIIKDYSWAEVDDPNDLAVAEFIFNKNRLNILENGFGGFWNYDLLDFCFIRNMYFPDSSIISEMKNNLSELIHNYGSRQLVLNTKMSWFLRCREDRIVALNGASQIYPLLQERLAGLKMLIPSPGFGEYGRIFKNSTRYYDEVGISTDEITAQMKNCDGVVIVNPNNPTGSVIPTQWIYHAASENPGKIFIVDESFIEFSEYESILYRLEDEPLNNIIMIKSLSKSLGIPGIRLGYLYCCDRQFTGYVMARTPIWNMNSLAEFTLETILKHRDTLEKSIRLTVRDREKFISNLSGLEIVDTVFPSNANFILLRLRQGADGQDIVEEILSKHSIYIKNVSDKFSGPENYLRLAVRLPQENNLLINALNKLEQTH